MSRRGSLLHGAWYSDGMLHVPQDLSSLIYLMKSPLLSSTIKDGDVYGPPVLAMWAAHNDNMTVTYDASCINVPAKP